MNDLPPAFGRPTQHKRAARGRLFVTEMKGKDCRIVHHLNLHVSRLKSTPRLSWPVVVLPTSPDLVEHATEDRLEFCSPVDARGVLLNGKTTVASSAKYWRSPRHRNESNAVRNAVATPRGMLR